MEKKLNNIFKTNSRKEEPPPLKKGNLCFWNDTVITCDLWQIILPNMSLPQFVTQSLLLTVLSQSTAPHKFPFSVKLVICLSSSLAGELCSTRLAELVRIVGFICFKIKWFTPIQAMNQGENLRDYNAHHQNKSNKTIKNFFVCVILCSGN